MRTTSRLIMGAAALATLALGASGNVAEATASGHLLGRDAPSPEPGPDGAVPPGFVAASTSWTSDSNGWLLGFSPCSAKAEAAGRTRCGTLLHTTDAGKSWKQRTVPGVRVSPKFIPVRIAFATKTVDGAPATGLATDGTRLFVTDDGAKTWQRAPVGAADIGDIGLTSTSAYAIVGKGTSADGTTSLVTSLRGADDWTAVPNVRTAGNGVNIDGGWDLQTRGSNGAVALGTIFTSSGYWTTTDGTTWTAKPAPCTSDQMASLNWVGAHRIVATCSYQPGRSEEFKDVRRSIDGGEFSTTTSAPNGLYTSATGAARPQRPFIGATGAGVAWLYGTFDRGASWQTVLQVDDELPFRDLQFTDATHGFVLTGGSAYDRGTVYTTTDGGQTWNPLDLG